MTILYPRPGDGILQVEQHVRQIDLRGIKRSADNIPFIALHHKTSISAIGP